MAERIDGKAVAAAVRQEVAQEVLRLKEEKGLQPGIAVVIVGDDPASRIYVNNKKKACSEVGIYSEEYALPASITQEELTDLIHQLNENPAIHGILVQSPLPKGLDEKAVVENIDPKKDVDAFHALNVGKIMIGDFEFLPCTPAGVIELLDRYGVAIEGKRCVVIGRSNIVGKPMAMLLLHRNGTVTICHSRTPDAPAICREADILIAASGRAGLVGSEYLRSGQTVIDVGINPSPDGGVCGDVNFAEAEAVIGAITPVPRGVGSVTTAVLCRHVVEAAERAAGY